MTEWSASSRRTWFGVFLAGAFALALLAGLAPIDASNASASPHHAVHATASATTVAGGHRRTPRHVAPTTEVTAASLAATSSTVAAPTPATSSAVQRVKTTSAKATATTVRPRPVVTTPPPPPPPPVDAGAAAFLACVRQRESHGNYSAVSPSGTYMGAYQFSQSAWDSAARHVGRLDLVGLKPNLASPADQDAMALALYEWLGAAPWGGACS